MKKPGTTWTMPLEGMRLRYIHESDDETVIGLQTEGKPVPCPKCQSSETVGYGRMNVRVRDEPLRCRKVFLDVKRRRLRCQSCLATFNEPLGPVSENHRATERLVGSIGKLALRLPFTVLSKRLGMDEKTIRTIFTDLLTALRDSPAPECTGSVVLWLPTILRVQRSVWVNKDECALVGMDADAKPSTVLHALTQLLKNGKVKAIYVPPNVTIIHALQESTTWPLMLHAAALKAACEQAIGSVRSSNDVTRYADAVADFLRSKNEAEAKRRWLQLLDPPPGLRTKMRQLITAVDAFGPSAFTSFREPDSLCDGQIANLEKLLASGFSRRSYDVVHAIMMFDKHLHKTERISTVSAGTSAMLEYKKTDFGTSIPKLITRLKSMAKESIEQEE